MSAGSDHKMILFRELAEVFQKLEQTSSNSALVAILAVFLARLTPDEARAVAYLPRGEVGAPFESREIGMAERMVVRAVVDAYAVSQQRVEKLLATAGDLGTVARKTLCAANEGAQSRSFTSLTNCSKSLRFREKARKNKSARDWRNCCPLHRGSKQNTSCVQSSAPIVSASPT